MRRFLIFVLCLATLAGAPLPAAQAGDADEVPCPMSIVDGTGAACEDCGDSKTICAEQCAALYAGTMTLQGLPFASASAFSESVAPATLELFRSRTGPPGLQPPR